MAKHMTREEYERIESMVRGGMSVRAAAGARLRAYYRYRERTGAASPARVPAPVPRPAMPLPEGPLTPGKIQAMTVEAVRMAAAQAATDPAWAKILFGYLRLLDPALSERRGGITPAAFAEEWERIRNKPRPPLRTWEEAHGQQGAE